ncbi:MAG: Flp family type IVb pilin [Holosporales bacterium]|jgi:Flp pilus assembly pilin Flp
MIKKLFTRLRRDTSGVTIIEYALLASLIAVALIAVLSLLRADVSESFSRIGSAINQ